MFEEVSEKGFMYFNSLPLRIGNSASLSLSFKNSSFNSLPLRIGNFDRIDAMGKVIIASIASL